MCVVFFFLVGQWTAMLDVINMGGNYTELKFPMVNFQSNC